MSRLVVGFLYLIIKKAILYLPLVCLYVGREKSATGISLNVIELVASYYILPMLSVFLLQENNNNNNNNNADL